MQGRPSSLGASTRCDPVNPSPWLPSRIRRPAGLHPVINLRDTAKIQNYTSMAGHRGVSECPAVYVANDVKKNVGNSALDLCRRLVVVSACPWVSGLSGQFSSVVEQRFCKPYYPIRDYTLNMHNNRMTTTPNRVYRVIV
jgi:hypothetical protein